MTCLEQDTRVGPGGAVSEGVAANEAFEIDTSRERLLCALNHDDFVKCLR